MEILTEKRFNHWQSKPNYWRNVSHIQTCVKSKKGIGKPIKVIFYAPIDLQEPDAEIKYDFRAIGDDVELLMKDEYKYCLKQCYKMAYFV